MVCYMYYTDVFVGSGNIVNLKDALNAVLKGSGLNAELTQLVHGLCLFMGYPSCLCSLKTNVNESLQDISRKLIQDSEAVQSSHSNLNFDINCSCIPKNIFCKCCVISCIKELHGQSKSQCPCPRLNNTSKECSCSNTNGKCCKDVLSGLEACLSLLNLKTDLKDCKCDPKTCCETGTCIKSCPVCVSKNFPEFAMTGLGICPMNPRKLAEKLDKFFAKPKGSSNCSCQCNGSESCCCLACPDCSSKNSCFCSSSGSSGQCSCASKLQLQPSQCPRKTFCEAIKDIKIAAESTDMTCCESGKKCHCHLPPGSPSPGQCCVEQLTGSKGKLNHQSLKCLLRRLVKFFKDLETSSQPKSSCLCCDLLCVLKMCESFKTFYDKRTATVCKTCKSKKGPGAGGCPKSGKCCSGSDPKCGSSGSGFCSKCSECRQICDSKKFHNAFNELSKTLQYSSPCGQELYRVLDGFIHFIRYVFMGNQNFIRNTVLKAVKDCSDCKKSGPNSKNWQACECSKNSGSSCSACTSLLQDSKLMSILRHGYVSSYVNSTWDSLCPKPPKCCCGQPSCPQCLSSSSCCQSQSSCDPSKCCPDCPQRKAAKIFLGMLPCLYYGLKILYDRCKYNSGFAGWHDISVNSDDKPESALAKFFHAWGYDLRPLKTKKGSEFFPLLDSLSTMKVLQKLSTLVTENYFTSNLISPPKDPKTPSTVRQMLLWLYGLPYTSGFSSLVENCKSLCLPFGKSFNADAFCYYIYTCCFILPVAIISLIEDSSSTATLLSSSSDWTSFSYPEDLSSLFEKLCEYARKIFVALAFLYYQCERVGSQGGWKDCAFGQRCSLPSTSVPSNSLSTSSSSSSGCSCKYSGAYLCTAINKDTVHDHCLKDDCRGYGSGSCSTHSSAPKCTPCPHPLMRFLVATSDSESYPFGLSDIVPMGFKTEHLPSTPVKGEKLYHAIYGFCKDGFYPLTRLVQFELCISQRPPETLLDLYAFFVKFKDSDVFKNDFASYASGEPGTPDGQALKDAIEKLYGSHSGSHSVANLFSLSGCHANKGSGASCGPYLHALTEEAYNIFIDKFADTYLSWVCYSAEKFYSEFKAFYEEAEKKFKTCCLTSCTKIVECPCALPFIYSHGFTFHSPSGLNCVDAQGTKHKGKGQGQPQHTGCAGKERSCQDFLHQLGLVVGPKSTLLSLIAEIEKFLWSIRKPFFFFILAFWAFVISYFLYVQLYKLDLLHLKSHAHFSRSFKILPSTLFSDASSKLKDLSYFTL
ncbi:variant erythrocyte surface antigen-1 family protein [Babesia divergens]|uniref:Variant erythrocyte surface antigen-1 family protein n=1 Tax=Babesia divergens TaxID=32595 RepID=A0AAD9GBX0_BABDI|nr:variant erythrocyte surface antigen-1 family protein [Babesia divergens]